FMGAVIDDRAYARVSAAIERAKVNPKATIIAGGGHDDSVGYFIEPTTVECTDPDDELFTTEFFGPLLCVYVYDDAAFGAVPRMVNTAPPAAPAGDARGTDGALIEPMPDALRHTAGNLYITDGPTGAVVGQQPFRGSRASGTNDKAGSLFNMVRWTSPRAIKETFNAPTDYRYPHML